MNVYERAHALNILIQESKNKKTHGEVICEEFGETFSRKANKFEEQEDCREILKEMGVSIHE